MARLSPLQIAILPSWSRVLVIVWFLSTLTFGHCNLNRNECHEIAANTPIGATSFTPRQRPIVVNYEQSRLEDVGPSNHVLEDVAGVKSLTNSRIAKVTATYNTQSPNFKDGCNLMALFSHVNHNRIWGYRRFIRNSSSPGFNGKGAYVLQILLEEMAKSPSQRLEWLFWHDANLAVMNDQIPLEVFLPPRTAKGKAVNLLIVNDPQGLADNAFFVRVSSWSLRFFAARLALLIDQHEGFEASNIPHTFAGLLQDDNFHEHVAYVPSFWFNAGLEVDSSVPPEWGFDYAQFKPGDFMVRDTCSDGCTEQQSTECSILNQTFRGTSHNVPLDQTRVYQHTQRFWYPLDKNDTTSDLDYSMCYQMVHDLGVKEDIMTMEIVARKMKMYPSQDESDDYIHARIKDLHHRREKDKLRVYREACARLMSEARNEAHI